MSDTLNASVICILRPTVMHRVQTCTYLGPCAGWATLSPGSLTPCCICCWVASTTSSVLAQWPHRMPCLHFGQVTHLVLHLLCSTC